MQGKQRKSYWFLLIWVILAFGPPLLIWNFIGEALIDSGWNKSVASVLAILVGFTHFAFIAGVLSWIIREIRKQIASEISDEFLRMFHDHLKELTDRDKKLIKVFYEGKTRLRSF